MQEFTCAGTTTPVATRHFAALKSSSTGDTATSSRCYYLIGARVHHSGAIVQHSLWANSGQEEKTIWPDFLSLLSMIPNPVLIHARCSKEQGPADTADTGATCNPAD